MKGRFAHALPIVLMLFLAALTLWLQYAVQMAGSDVSASKRHDPDAVIDNFTIRRLGEQGKPRHSLTASKMMHFPDDNTTEILYPHVTYLDDAQGNMTVTASRGVLTNNGDEAFLYGNVMVEQDTTPAREGIKAQTEYLHLHTEKRTGQTDRPVMIVQGRSVLTGVGMMIREDARELTLMSQVKGTFDAPKRK